MHLPPTSFFSASLQHCSLVVNRCGSSGPEQSLIKNVVYHSSSSSQVICPYLIKLDYRFSRCGIVNSESDKSSFLCGSLLNGPNSLL